MKNPLFALAKQTLIYGISGVAIQAVGLVTLPIFARVFSQAAYGVLEIGTVTLAVLAILADVGFASSSQRSYFDYSDAQPLERRLVLSTAVLSSTAAAAATAGVLVVAREPVSRWLFGGEPQTTLLVLIAATLPVIILAQFTREVMRLRFRAWHYVVSSTIGAALTAGIGIVAVVWLDRGVDGVFWGALGGAAAAALYGLIVSYRYVGLGFSRSKLRTMLAYGVPLIPASLALWSLTFIDRIMLARLDGLAEVGEYAVANRVAMPLLFLISAFATAFSPFILSTHAEDPEAEKRVRGRVLTYVTLVLVLAALGLSLFAREIIEIVAPSYDRAFRAVGLVAFGLVTFGLSSVTMVGISLVRRTGYFALYSGIAAGINIALNFVLIPPWGMFGAGAATAVAYGLLAGLYYWKAQQIYPTPFELRKVLTIFALGALLTSIGALVIEPFGLAIAVKLAALGFFALALLPLGVLHRDEIAGLNAAASRSLRKRATETRAQ
ncbi:MAG: hypothetical protein QOJ82_1020 [Solirubrobacteraceae bacterium]|nr:hypothetical protein [Solirubrobacteraceae bacterium]